MTMSKRGKSKPPTERTPIGDRLTARDAELLRLIAEHRMLTTSQLTCALIPNERTCRGRIGVLRALGLVETFRPPGVSGSSPQHCVATAKALRLLADAGYADRVPVVRGSAPRGAVAASTALRSDLAHLAGTNEVFCRLRAAARASGGRAALEEWRSEWSTARAFAAQIRPDGFARWRDGAAWCEFFLEYDTGTEALHRLVAKLRGYAALASATAVSSPVLFWLPTALRESNLHDVLATFSASVPVVTAHGDPRTASPDTAIWQPLWDSSSRISLAAIGAVAAAHLGAPQRSHTL